MPDNDQQRYAPGTGIHVLGSGRRVVDTARFDDKGRCIEWKDTEGDVHRPWVSSDR